MDHIAHCHPWINDNNYMLYFLLIKRNYYIIILKSCTKDYRDLHIILGKPRLPMVFVINISDLVGQIRVHMLFWVSDSRLINELSRSGSSYLEDSHEQCINWPIKSSYMRTTECQFGAIQCWFYWNIHR